MVLLPLAFSMPLLPVFLLEFIEALTAVIWIIDFLVVYNMFYPEIIRSKLVGVVMTVVIMFLLVIPYTFMAWLVFLMGFAYSFFWGFRPWTWAQEKDVDLNEEKGA